MTSLAEIWHQTKWWLLLLLVGLIWIWTNYTNYNNFLAVCDRTNIVRETLIDVSDEMKAHGAKEKLTSTPYSNPNGTVRCHDAIHSPLSLP